MTQEELATNAVTSEHIRLVVKFLHRCIKGLLDRADAHDLSKLEEPEVGMFTEFTAKLAKSTYGSSEYDEFLRQMGPALKHHYARNRHHPEHHTNGIYDMNLLDLIEMFCDWKAASLRHDDGNIRISIEKNGDRFEMSKQLIGIFYNTVEVLED